MLDVGNSLSVFGLNSLTDVQFVPGIGRLDCSREYRFKGLGINTNDADKDS